MSNGQPVNQQLITRFIQDLRVLLRLRPELALESLTHSTPEMSFDLGKARKNKVIHNRAGDRIFVTDVTGLVYIRFNSATGSKYRLRLGKISTPFQKLYLENEAQAGKSVSIIIGYGAFVDFVASNRDLLTTISGKDFATQATLALIKAKTDKLDVNLSTIATQATLALIKAKTDNLDVALSTKAKESDGNLADVKTSTAKLDIFISELRDAITGVIGAKTLLDVVNAFEELPEKTEIQATAFTQQSAVNVGTTATLILAENANRKGFYIRHNGDAIIFLGNATVVIGNGLPFFPGNIFNEENLPVTAAIYGVVAADTEEVRRVEET